MEAHRAAGVAYIPEDRAAVGSALGRQRRPTISPWASIARRPSRAGRSSFAGAFAERARALIRRFAIRIPNERVNVGTLSGGNLQKVVVARELSHEAPVLIAEQPTRGLDVGATEYIHEQLVAERDKGRAVLSCRPSSARSSRYPIASSSCSRGAFSPTFPRTRPTRRASGS